MNKELLELLKKLPKSRYEELINEAGTDFDAAKIKDALAAEGIELNDEQAKYLEEALKAKNEEASMQVDDEQLKMVSGGAETCWFWQGHGSGGCV